MDCEQVREELDALALGALSNREAADVEQHVAGCLSCWEELQKARETASLLTLTVPMHEASPGLREKIITQAQRETTRTSVPIGREEKQGFFGRFGWGVATGFAAIGALGAFAFAAFLQVQVNDLEDDKSGLETQVEDAGNEINEQNAVLAVLAAPDAVKVEMQPVSDVRTEAQPVASYNWSGSNDRGYIFCQNMPALAEGETFTVWLTFESGDPAPIGEFTPTMDKCQAALEFGDRGRPKGIGITREQDDAAGTDPNLPWLLYASFEDE